MRESLEPRCWRRRTSSLEPGLADHLAVPNQLFRSCLCLLALLCPFSLLGSFSCAYLWFLDITLYVLPAGIALRSGGSFRLGLPGWPSKSDENQQELSIDLEPLQEQHLLQEKGSACASYSLPHWSCSRPEFTSGGLQGRMMRGST